MKQIFAKESYLKLIYKREGRSSFTTESCILEPLAIGSSPESTTSKLSDVIEKPSTSKSDLNLKSSQKSDLNLKFSQKSDLNLESSQKSDLNLKSSQKCIFTKQAAMKTPKDSTNESYVSNDKSKDI